MAVTSGKLPLVAVPVSLRHLERHEENPLLETLVIETKNKIVASIKGEYIPDRATGEVVAQHAIFVRRTLEKAEFVKMFDDGLRAAYDLTGPGYKVFQLVLRVIRDGPMQTDQVVLHPDIATKGEKKMSDKTYWRGMRELVTKGFLAASTVPHIYWTNPAMFFKGDRVRFINDYQLEKEERVIKKVGPSTALPTPEPSLFDG